MDKQKQIEEMAKELRWLRVDEHDEIANRLYAVGYRKIPEGAVVIDKNEKSTEKQLEKLGYIKLKNDKIVISLEEHGRSLLDAYHNGKDKATAAYEERLKTIRKETAEKFAEMVKEMHDYDEVLCDIVDEICKKITEGKV